MNHFHRLRLGPRDRRALRLGALIVLPILFLLYGVRPYIDARTEALKRIESERAAYARELRLIADAERFPELNHQVRESLDREAGRLFNGPNEATAAAALAEFVVSRAKESEMLVQQTSSRQADSLGKGIQRLSMEIQGVSDLNGVLQFLAVLEGGQKLIDIEEIQLERREGLVIPTAQDDSTSASSQPSLLSLSAVISAYAVGAIELEPTVEAPLASSNQ